MSGKEAEILEQQNTQFYRIKEVLGTDTLAFFCCCVMFDKPFIPECMPGQGGDWPGYLRKLKFRKKDDLGLRGGVTDVLQMYGDDVDTVEMVQYERSKNPEVSDVGTPKQVKAWGKGSDEAPFTKDDYDRLDDIFEIVSDRLVSAGGMDVQQEDTLRQTSIMRLMRDKFIQAGDKESIAKAKQLDSMIKENLSAEQLRKADARPVEDVRIDSIVDALEKWGAVKDGKILSFPDLTEFLLKQLGRLGGTPAHKYTQTLDAADYELWFIQNCMAQNEDLPKWVELPDNMRFPEEVASEFADKPSDDEKRAYEGIGLVRNANKT